MNYGDDDDINLWTLRETNYRSQTMRIFTCGTTRVRTYVYIIVSVNTVVRVCIRVILHESRSRENIRRFAGARKTRTRSSLIPPARPQRTVLNYNVETSVVSAQRVNRNHFRRFIKLCFETRNSNLIVSDAREYKTQRAFRSPDTRICVASSFFFFFFLTYTLVYTLYCRQARS